MFAEGSANAQGKPSSDGIDFNYGATPDLQLTAVFPVASEAGLTGLGNVELAAKYRFFHQRHGGWDVAVFPRLFLPSASQNHCLSGWALAPQFSGSLQAGAELVYQTSLVHGGRASTSIGGGLRYDLSKMCDLIAYLGPGLQNRDETNRYFWYASLLLTI